MSDGKLNLSEHVDALFEGVEVTDEQRSKMETVLEAAVSSIIKSEKVKLQESLDAKVDALVEARVTSNEETVSKYLDYVIKEWVEENKLAIESGLKVEMAESLFNGMKSLMVEHNVNVPEGQENIVTSQEAEILKLKENLNDSKSKLIELSGEIEARDRLAIFDEASKGLTDTQKEKFSSLAEDIEFKDSEKFKQKLGIIREGYFKSGEEDPVDGKKTLKEEVLPSADPRQARLDRIRNPYKV